MKVDAIVAAGSAEPGCPAPTGGANGRIHQRAGTRLLEALRRIGGVRTADVTLTKAYDLPCRYVIHTAGPKWQGGSYGEERLLQACYREALRLADRKGVESIAFPLISTGQYGYPKAEALRVATDVIRDFLCGHDMTVYLVVYDREAFRLSSELFEDVAAYIDQHYVDSHPAARNMPQRLMLEHGRAPECDMAPVCRSAPCAAPMPRTAAAAEDGDVPAELARRLRALDEGFSGTLLRLIDERGMKDAECYRRANVDRKLFSKIRSTPSYRPKKPTVMAFCVALELEMPQARELLAKAGYGMSRASMFDVIVEFFITRGVYDVHTINQALWHYDQPLLGSDKGA